MAKTYRVTLTPEERVELDGMLGKWKADARKLADARVLLPADETEGDRARQDAVIAAGLELTTRTVERVRRRFVEAGWDAALLPEPSKRVYARVLGGKQMAHRTARA